jgi:hypothetical protein
MPDTANAGSKVATRSAGHIGVEERTMLWNASAFNGYAIEASDGRIHFITVDKGMAARRAGLDLAARGTLT